jgi:GNAT superfamily N-acetyltransferase
VEPWDSVAIAAQASYYRFLATSPRAKRREVGDGFAVVSGMFSNTENGVVAQTATADEITATLAWLQERYAPAMWLNASASLRQQLVAAGARPDVGGVDMGADLRQLDLPTSKLGSEIRIAPVRSIEELARVLSIMRLHGDHFRNESEEHRAAQLFASLRLAGDAALQHYLATEDGEDVGMATAYFADTVVLLQHVIVIPSRRRQGIGRALALARLTDAIARGCTFAVLGPTPESEALYRPLGFTTTPGRETIIYLPLSERE